MIKLQPLLARFIVPVLCLNVLSLMAETSTQSPTTIFSPSPLLMTVSCNSLLDPTMLSRQTTGVQQRLKVDSAFVNNRQCIILSANPAENLNELIERIPEDTVILLSSKTVTPTTASPSIAPVLTTTPVFASTPVEYFVSSAIRLKNGQDILGAADLGFAIIRNRPAFKDKYMLGIGTTDDFKPDETKSSRIQYIAFRPTRENNRLSIDSIVFAECYNRKLILAANDIHLSVRAAVVLDCRKSLDASADDRMRGPGLQIYGNLIEGKKYSTIHNPLPHLIPDMGILIHLPGIRNQTEQLIVISNTFMGNMAQAGEFRMAPGSSMDVIENEVDISNVGFTRRNPSRKGAFVLAGVKDTEGSGAVEAGLPRFYMIDNYIKATRTAITVWGGLELNLACNRLQASNPWWQPLNQSSLKAVHKSLEDLRQKLAEHKASDLCHSYKISSVVMPTPTPYTSNPMVNTWIANNHSTSTACNGLVNLEGQLFFETEICQPVTPPTASNTGAALSKETRYRYSAGAAIVTSALGVVATLAVLLTL
ncbi:MULTISPECIES: hypothetical protein [unclassified Endozoicomonas]|uniref:hypothetical protein n=1 Tax=unclassified Endozoicomonas TaxID=2644528 RepID=UPI0021477A90|nr:MULTISPECIES: hypothetical protein [unclassified Endozoicomonas]